MRATIRTDQKYQILEDGSLVIQDVNSKDEAYYTCEAGNGVGTGIQKSIRLSVIGIKEFKVSFVWNKQKVWKSWGWLRRRSYITISRTEQK